jgi:type VI secretion system lysozyme-like protein
MRLLERLHSFPIGERFRAQWSRQVIIDSITHHLTLLLNARHGQALTVPNYGLPADIMTIAHMEPFKLLNAVQQTITWYEPRLQHVHVFYLEQNGIGCRLRIEALLPAQPTPLSVLFDAIFDMCGTARLRAI